VKRILVYSHDTYGLGNIRRILALAEHMIDVREDVSILLVSGSPMLHAFRVSPRIDYVKLPCLSRRTDGSYGVKSLGITYDATLRMRSSLITAAMSDFEPHLVLVDKKPFGVADELRPALELVAALPNRPRVALVLRDILDSPKVTQAIWDKRHYHDAISAHYDRVLVLGSESVYDVVSRYGFPESTARKVVYCGYLRRQPGRVGREEMRNQLGVDGDEPLVLVTPGGGEDGHILAGAYLEALQRERHLDHRTVLMCGPEMLAEQRELLMALSDGSQRVTAMEFTDDMMSYVGASDLLVSMGGYNTVCEFLSAGRRAVMVPRTRPVSEQLIRAQLLADRGLARLVHPDDVSPKSLAAAVCDETTHPASPPSEMGIDLGGLDRAEREMSELLADG